MINKIFNSKRGFTVLETIIAITVVSLAIAGATSAVRMGLIGASIAKDQVKAFYFAEEAIEMLRNRRDHNILKIYRGDLTHTWLTGITIQDPNSSTENDRGHCSLGSTCIVDIFNLKLIPCSGSWGSCAPLLQNGSIEPAAYVYGYNSGWTQTPFTREIQIESITPNEINVTVLISWRHGSVTRSFKTKTTLLNWFGP